MSARPVLRGLALGHVTWGLALLALAVWFAFSVFRILPAMSRGTVAENLPGALLFAVLLAGPPACLGAWMVLLGRDAWCGHPKLRVRLFWTHGLSLPIGALALVLGLTTWRAGEESAARGGGLLGGIGLFPLAFGAATVVLAALSLVVVWYVRDHRAAPRSP